MQRTQTYKPDSDLTLAEFIRSDMIDFTQSERRASHVLLSDYPFAGLGTVAEFAKKVGVSSPSILRFVARLGFSSFPDFQKHLREELAVQVRSPLTRTFLGKAPSPGAQALQVAADAMVANVKATVSSIPPAEIGAIVDILVDPKRRISLLGGRFSSSLAALALGHLKIIRKNVAYIETHPDILRESLLDLSAKDVLIVYDVRRYSPQTLAFCKSAYGRGASIVLITDAWLSPVSRVAKHVLPAHIETHATWDSLASLLLITEALISEATKKLWPTASKRMKYLEAMRSTAI